MFLESVECTGRNYFTVIPSRAEGAMPRRAEISKFLQSKKFIKVLPVFNFMMIDHLIYFLIDLFLHILIERLIGGTPL